MDLARLSFIMLMLAPATDVYCEENLPAQLPEPFTGVYSFSKDGMVFGETVRTLKRIDEQTFLFKSVSRATGLQAWMTRDRLIEQSEWINHNGRPRPVAYRYDRLGGPRERHVRITFDWKKSTVINSVGGHSWHMAVPGETMDKLLYQLALTMDLANGEQLVEYPIADGGRLKRYRFKVIGREMVPTPLGHFETLKVQRLGDQRETTLWCAPALHYLPVRIEQENRGSRVRLNLKSLQRKE